MQVATAWLAAPRTPRAPRNSYITKKPRTSHALQPRLVGVPFRRFNFGSALHRVCCYRRPSIKVGHKLRQVHAPGTLSPGSSENWRLRLLICPLHHSPTTDRFSSLLFYLASLEKTAAQPEAEHSERFKWNQNKTRQQTLCNRQSAAVVADKLLRQASEFTPLHHTLWNHSTSIMILRLEWPCP